MKSAPEVDLSICRQPRDRSRSGGRDDEGDGAIGGSRLRSKTPEPCRPTTDTMVVAEAPKSSSSAPPPCLPDDFVPVPVTLLSGFLGAGKTTLLRIMLHQAHEGENAKKVAVLVNDMAEINIDANLVKETKLLQSEEKLVELQNGCICCTLREDLVKALADLASEDKRFDAIVVESTGVSLPNEVADTFVADVPPPGDQPALGLPANVKNTKKNQELLKKVQDEQEEQRRALESITRALRGKRTLNEIARLDTCVTMVDCASFDANMATANEMREQFADSVEKTDLRNVGPLLTSQIEFADVLILSKCDLVSAEKAGAVEDAVRALNPSAKVLRALKGDVNLSEVLCTNSFSMKRAANGAGWMKILDGDDVPETEEYGIHSFVYKARTPFHPMRLWAILSAIFYVKYENDSMEVKGEERDFQVRQAVRSARMKKAFGQILRSKGGLWLAGRDHLMCGWSQGEIPIPSLNLDLDLTSQLSLSLSLSWRCGRLQLRRILHRFPSQEELASEGNQGARQADGADGAHRSGQEAGDRDHRPGPEARGHHRRPRCVPHHQGGSQGQGRRPAQEGGRRAAGGGRP